jgi:hypothetical protein
LLLGFSSSSNEGKAPNAPIHASRIIKNKSMRGLKTKSQISLILRLSVPFDLAIRQEFYAN